MTFNIENPITRLNNQIAGLKNSQIEILTFNKVFDSPGDQVANLVDDSSKLTDKEIIGASLRYIGGDGVITLGKNTTETFKDSQEIGTFISALNAKISNFGFQFVYYLEDDEQKIDIQKTSPIGTTITIKNNSSIMSKFGFNTDSDFVISGSDEYLYPITGVLQNNYFTVDAESDTLSVTTAVTDVVDDTTQTTKHEFSFFSLIQYFYNDLLTITDIKDESSITLSVSPFNKLIYDAFFIKRFSANNNILNVTLKLIVKNKEQQLV